MTEFEEYTLRKAIERFGVTGQLIKLTEECGELVQAVGKCLEAQDAEAFGKAMDHMAEEMADVGILIDQFRLLFPDVIQEPLREWRVKKVDRLAERLEAECDG